MAILNLPIDVPWKLIGVSEDMMDTQFCSGFPPPWKSSIAIFAYEPKTEDFPEEGPCEKITYLKVTCNITGYQLSKEEMEKCRYLHPNIDPANREQVEKLCEEYLGCYGVLLNVAVHPYSSTGKIRELKRFGVDFTKLRLSRGGQRRLSSPYQDNQVNFQAEPENLLVDFHPQGGDGKGELIMKPKITATFPTSARVEARVVHDGTQAGKVTMEAYKGDQLVGSPQTTGPDGGRIYKLTIDTDGIDNIVLKTGSRASLLEFAYHVLQERLPQLNDYPHIVDFEPKMRDLYQSASETAEVLTASTSEVATTKSFGHAQDSQTGIGAKAGLSYGPAFIEAGLTHSWGETSQDSSSTQIDALRDRRESQSTTTNLSQMYNLMTGYHVGTNRAVFLMLPRPHTLQPTDRRTFIRGLRIIEGIQDFFLIIARPHDSMEGLCVEARLETGHFPENIEMEQQLEQYEEDYQDFEIDIIVPESSGTNNNIRLDTIVSIIRSGFIVDTRNNRIDRQQADPGHTGVKFLEDRSYQLEKPDNPVNLWVANYEYGAISPTSVQVRGLATEGDDEDTRLIYKYRILTRSENPIQTRPSSVVSRFLISSRGLCTCFRSTEKCPEIIPLDVLIEPLKPPLIPGEWLVDERTIDINSTLLMLEGDTQARLPAMREVLRKVQFAMSTSWKLPSRRPYGKMRLSDSNYFMDRITKILSTEFSEKRLTTVKGLPRKVVRGLDPNSRIIQALDMNLSDFATKTGLTMEDAAKARSMILGFTPQPKGKSSKKRKSVRGRKVSK